MNYLLIFIGDRLGSVLRFVIAMLFGKTTLLLPWAILSSNVVICLIFGTIIYIYQETI